MCRGRQLLRSFISPLGDSSRLTAAARLDEKLILRQLRVLMELASSLALLDENFQQDRIETLSASPKQFLPRCVDVSSSSCLRVRCGVAT
ncbi:hypothetical protein HN011_000920 [Eciton burchellii]|nr:hypothetical protein HN011_000920 [Eciton burchellii]